MNTRYFQEGVSHESLYEMEFGALMITVCASKVSFDLSQEGGTIDLTYAIDIEQTAAGYIEYHLDGNALNVKYTVKNVGNNAFRYCSNLTKNPDCKCNRVFGGDNWNRTSDLMHVKHAL